jgi:hypothetical protein
MSHDGKPCDCHDKANDPRHKPCTPCAQAAKAMADNMPQGLGAAANASTLGIDTVSAAQAVADYFNTHPCTQDAVDVVYTFQQLWNRDAGAGSSLQLGYDGQYGPLTQGAVQNALGTVAVPPNCFGGPATPIGPTPTPPSPIPVPTPPAPGPLPPQPVSPPAGGSVSPWLFIGGVLLVAGTTAAYTYNRRKKR